MHAQLGGVCGPHFRRVEIVVDTELMIKRARKPSTGSLRWFRDTWEALFADRSSDGEVKLAHAVAQLSYENRKLRERLGDLEELVGDIAAKTGEDFETIFDLQKRTEIIIKSGFSSLGVTVREVRPGSNFVPCGNPNCVGCKKVQDIQEKITNDGMMVIDGTPHLQECAVVEGGKDVTCTCGSEGERERQERLSLCPCGFCTRARQERLRSAN